MEPTNTQVIHATPRKAPIPVSERGIVINDMDSLWRFAQYVAVSGLAPKGIEKPEAIFVAIQMGLEVGLSPMAALQNIAVINGRPTIWGDAQLGIVRATGELEEFAEWYEVGGQKTTRNPTTFSDDVTAVCHVKRKGYEAQDSAFSVADAKRAGLWAKAGTWTQYPARMLRWRSRGFNLRDNFGDALRGMISTEEAMDIPRDVIDVTPKAVRGQSSTVTVPKTTVTVEPSTPSQNVENDTSTKIAPRSTDDPPFETMKSAMWEELTRANFDMNSLIEVCATNPKLSARSQTWNNLDDVSRDDISEISSNLIIGNGELKWKTKRATAKAA